MKNIQHARQRQNRAFYVSFFICFYFNSLICMASERTTSESTGEDSLREVGSRRSSVSEEPSSSFSSPIEVRRDRSTSLSPDTLRKSQQRHSLTFKHKKLSRGSSKQRKSHDSSDYDDDTLKDEEGRWRNIFLGMVVNSLQDRDFCTQNAKLISICYPLFTNEKSFFPLLLAFKERHPQKIKLILEQLGLALYPNGADNIIAVISEFDELKRGLVTSPIFGINFLKMLVVEPTTLKYPTQFSRIDVGDHTFDVSKFSEDLTLRDVILFKNISLSDIKSHLENEGSIPASIENLRKSFDRTAHWIVLQIVSQKEDEKRKTVIENFFSIGISLLEKNNFHGTMQVYSALSSARVKRLMSERALKSESWLKISEAMDPTQNYKMYREMLSGKQGTETCLPIYSVIHRDLIHAYEAIRSLSGTKGVGVKADKLEEMAGPIETFSICKMLPCSGSLGGEYFGLVCGFSEINEELLDVLSSLRQDWPILWNTLPRDFEQPKELKGWTPLYLASQFIKGGCKDQIEKMFDQGIHDGAGILEYLNDTKTGSQRDKLSQLGLNEQMASTIISANF